MCKLMKMPQMACVPIYFPLICHLRHASINSKVSYFHVRNQGIHQARTYQSVWIPIGMVCPSVHLSRRYASKNWTQIFEAFISYKLRKRFRLGIIWNWMRRYSGWRPSSNTFIVLIKYQATGCAINPIIFRLARLN